MLQDLIFDETGFADRETFVIRMVAELCDTLEGTIGIDDLEGLIGIVAHRLARDVSSALCAGQDRPLAPAHTARACCALKARIGGRFRVESADGTGIILVGNGCPFGQAVRGRESLCRMTSGVFGRLAADQTGYALVTIEESFARGDAGCRVSIDFDPRQFDRRHTGGGYVREYFGRVQA